MMNTQSLQINEYNPTALAIVELNNRFKGVVFEVSTTKGMKDAREARSEIKGYRVALEKLRKEIKEPALKRCRLIDFEAQTITQRLLELEEPIDRQIKEEEKRKEEEARAKAEAERIRIETIRDRISKLNSIPSSLANQSSNVVKQAIEKLESVVIDESEFAEFFIEAKDVHGKTLTVLKKILSDREIFEQEQERIRVEREELSRLRAEQEERTREENRKLMEAKLLEELRISQEREAEQAKLKAEREAEQAKLKAERKAEQAKLKAEREAEQAKLKAEREAEQKRMEEQRQSIEAEQEAERKKLADERAAMEIEKQRLAEQDENRFIDEQIMSFFESVSATEEEISTVRPWIVRFVQFQQQNKT